MNNCEIVDNTACGVAFQYCRTHKVEPHQCPGAKAAPELDTHAIHMEVAAKYWGKGLVETMAPEREFRAGDKVRVLVDFPYCAKIRSGTVLTVKTAKYDSPANGWDLYFEENNYSVYSRENGLTIVEHV